MCCLSLSGFVVESLKAVQSSVKALKSKGTLFKAFRRTANYRDGAPAKTNMRSSPAGKETGLFMLLSLHHKHCAILEQQPP